MNWGIGGTKINLEGSRNPQIRDWAVKGVGLEVEDKDFLSFKRFAAWRRMNPSIEIENDVQRLTLLNNAVRVHCDLENVDKKVRQFCERYRKGN